MRLFAGEQKSIAEATFLIDINVLTQLNVKSSSSKVARLEANKYFKSILESIREKSSSSISIRYIILIDEDDLANEHVRKYILMSDDMYFHIEINLSEIFGKIIKTLFGVHVLRENLWGCPTKDKQIAIPTQRIAELHKIDPKSIFVFAKKGSALHKQSCHLGYKVFTSHSAGEVDLDHFSTAMEHFDKKEFKNVVMATDYDDTIVVSTSSKIMKKPVINSHVFEKYSQLSEKIGFQSKSPLVITARRDPKLLREEIIDDFCKPLMLQKEKVVAIMEEDVEILLHQDPLEEYVIKTQNLDEKQLQEFRRRHKKFEKKLLKHERSMEGVHDVPQVVREFLQKVGVEETVEVIYTRKEDGCISKLRAIKKYLENNTVDILIYFEDNFTEFSRIENEISSFQKQGIIIAPIYVYGAEEFSLNTENELMRSLLTLKRSGISTRPALFHLEHKEAKAVTTKTSKKRKLPEEKKQQNEDQMVDQMEDQKEVEQVVEKHHLKGKMESPQKRRRHVREEVGNSVKLDDSGFSFC